MSSSSNVESYNELISNLKRSEYQNEKLLKNLSREKSKNNELLKQVEALKWYLVSEAEIKKSMEQELHYLRLSQGLEYQEMDLRGALGRMTQEFYGPNKEKIINGLIDVDTTNNNSNNDNKNNEKGVLLTRMNRYDFMEHLKYSTTWLTPADIQIISLRFSDGVDVLIHEFITFTRDLELKYSDFDNKDNELMIEALVSLKVDAFVQTIEEYPDVSKLIKAPVVDKQRLLDSIKKFDKIKENREKEEEAFLLKEAEAVEALKIRTINAQKKSYPRRRESRIIRGLDLYSYGKQDDDEEEEDTFIRPKKKDRVQIFYESKPDLFAITLLNCSSVDSRDDINNNGIERALRLLMPDIQNIDIVVVQMAVADDFRRGKCPIVSVLSYLSDGKVNRIEDINVYKARHREREQREKALQSMMNPVSNNRNNNSNNNSDNSNTNTSDNTRTTGSTSASTGDEKSKSRKGMMKSLSKWFKTSKK